MLLFARAAFLSFLGACLHNVLHALQGKSIDRESHLMGGLMPPIPCTVTESKNKRPAEEVANDR
jgi:hypothetical protein